MQSSRRVQAVAGIASGLIVAGIALVLITGLRVDWRGQESRSLISLAIEPKRPRDPEPKPPPPRTRKSAPKDAAAPPALRNQATQIVALPVVPLIVPPPVPVAPIAGSGSAASQGAADLPGPGQGAGGLGDGTGGGGDGDGDGGVPETGPRQIRGKLSYRDLPDGLLDPGGRAAVGVRYTVGINGRISNCVADQPSLYPLLNELTCRLIEQRFVYRPAHNRSGQPVRSIIVETHTWFSREREE